MNFTINLALLTLFYFAFTFFHISWLLDTELLNRKFSDDHYAHTKEVHITPNHNGLETGWSNWKPWDTFPHEQIQIGMSNMDYGGLMDTEYICFGSVSSENEQKKSQFYWYRIAKKVEEIGHDTFVQIEIGCWIDNQFKATMPVNGIVILKNP